MELLLWKKTQFCMGTSLVLYKSNLTHLVLFCSYFLLFCEWSIFCLEFLAIWSPYIDTNSKRSLVTISDRMLHASCLVSLPREGDEGGLHPSLHETATSIYGTKIKIHLDKWWRKVIQSTFSISRIYISQTKSEFLITFEIKMWIFYSPLLPTGGLGEIQRGTQETKLFH